MKFYWDESIRQFRDENGRVISDARMRIYIDAMCAALALVFLTRAERLKNEFTLENFQTWNIQSRVDIKSLHYAMMMVAFGGRSQMSNPEWLQAEEKIEFHTDFFTAFSQDVALGKVTMDGHFPVRTSMYALAGHSSYQDGVRIRETNAGRTEEKRETTSGNPCIDCKTAKALGWQPIGTLPAIGNSVCLTRCRCYYLYR